MSKIKIVEAQVNPFADEEHAGKAQALFATLKNALPPWLNFGDAPLSDRQLMCISSLATDRRLDPQQRKVLLVLALKSGPQLDRHVPHQELVEGIAQYEMAMLMLAEPAGRA